MLIQVDHVSPQPPEGSLDCTLDVRARAAPVGAVSHRLAELRRKHDPLAAPLEDAAEQLFAAALPTVDVGRVEERHVDVEGSVDNSAGCGLVETAAEVLAAEAG